MKEAKRSKASPGTVPRFKYSVQDRGNRGTGASRIISDLP